MLCTEYKCFHIFQCLKFYFSSPLFLVDPFHVYFLHSCILRSSFSSSSSSRWTPFQINNNLFYVQSINIFTTFCAKSFIFLLHSSFLIYSLLSHSSCNFLHPRISMPSLSSSSRPTLPNKGVNNNITIIILHPM